MEEALRIVASDPRTETESLECTRVSGDVYRIAVDCGDEILAVLYRVDDEKKAIDLIRVKPVGALRRTLDWLRGLLDYRP